MTETEQEWLSFLQNKSLHTSEIPYFCQQLHFLTSVDSTNEEVKRQAEQKAPHGSVYIAETQTHGKGRLGRKWTSPTGTGLYFSILLYPEKISSDIRQVTLIAGLAVCRAIRQLTGCPALIKWPNDIVIGPRKICGILTECSTTTDQQVFISVGIGINVNTQYFPEDLLKKGSSLFLETGKSQNRADLLFHILEQLENLYEQSASPIEEYTSLCVTVGKEVLFTRKDQVLSGKAVKILSNGELLVHCSNGQDETVSSGEVSVQGIY